MLSGLCAIGSTTLISRQKRGKHFCHLVKISLCNAGERRTIQSKDDKDYARQAGPICLSICNHYSYIMSYYELWTILENWKSDFSAEEFARAFRSPDPRKVLSDMSSKGLLRRKARGRYEVVNSENYAKSKNNIDEAYELLKSSKLPYALSKVDGVFVWTKGGYNANRFFGSYPVYLTISKSDIEDWKTFLRDNGKKYTFGGTRPSETLYGTYYVLLPEDKVESRNINGLNVEPLEKTIDFCLRESYTYEPALEMLDIEYNLGLGRKYEEVVG